MPLCHQLLLLNCAATYYEDGNNRNSVTQAGGSCTARQRTSPLSSPRGSPLAGKNLVVALYQRRQVLLLSTLPAVAQRILRRLPNHLRAYHRRVHPASMASPHGNQPRHPAVSTTAATAATEEAAQEAAMIPERALLMALLLCWSPSLILLRRKTHPLHTPQEQQLRRRDLPPGRQPKPSLQDLIMCQPRPTARVSRWPNQQLRPSPRHPSPSKRHRRRERW